MQLLIKYLSGFTAKMVGRIGISSIRVTPLCFPTQVNVASGFWLATIEIYLVY